MKTMTQQVLDQADMLDLDEKITNDPTAITFADFDVPQKLMQSLQRMNFQTPTPIQAKAIPLALQQRDILGSAQTGTGKTGAFGIPMISRLMEDTRLCALVMTPTRELAAQVMAAMQQMIPVPTIKTALLIGGESMPKQFKQLQLQPRLVVGTPGRINDHLMRRTLDLRYTRFLVLDEMDRMLDMGFGVQIDKILSYMPSDNRQTLMFSATMPAGIIKLSQKYMNNPERIAIGSTTTPTARIKQEVMKLDDSKKYDHLLQQLEKRDGSIIIFVRTKHGADRMATKLNREGHMAEAIHGDLQQRKRDRVIQEFREKKHRILVATDVAARGLDIPHIEHVINYDLPQVPEDYIHRIGRTGRAGAEGSALNFVSPSENNKWKAIQRLIHDGESSEDSFTKQPSKSRSGNGNSAAKPFGRKDYGDQQWKSPKSQASNGAGRFARGSDTREQYRGEQSRGQYRDQPRNQYRGPSADQYGDQPREQSRDQYRDHRFDHVQDNYPPAKQSEPRFGGFGAGRGDRKRAAAPTGNRSNSGRNGGGAGRGAPAKGGFAKRGPAGGAAKRGRSFSR